MNTYKPKKNILITMSFKNKIETIIQDVWFGREDLSKVFWIYKVAIGGFIGIVFQVCYLTQELKSLSMAILAFYIIYHVWVLKGLLASKNNVKKFHFISSFIVYFVAVNTFSLIILLYNVFKNI